MELKKLCQNCCNRERDGFCKEKQAYVPRKHTKEGKTPSSDCVTFKKK